MTIYDVVENGISYLILAINYEHSKLGDSIQENTNLDRINGFSCCWFISKSRKFEKVVIYLRHTKEIYIADYTRKEAIQRKDKTKYKIFFENTQKIGKTTLDWVDFMCNKKLRQISRTYYPV